MIKSKKAQVFQITYVVLVIIGFIGLTYLYLYLSNDVECSGLNPSCPGNQYCGVDFNCQDFPDLSKTTTQTETITTYQFFPGVIFILLSLLISYLILRRHT